MNRRYMIGQNEPLGDDSFVTPEGQVFSTVQHRTDADRITEAVEDSDEDQDDDDRADGR